MTTAPVVTHAMLEAAAQAHDREDSAQRGEPSPWSIEWDSEEAAATFRSDRISCMKEAFVAAGFHVEPTGIGAACHAMRISSADRQRIDAAVMVIRARGRVDNETFRQLLECLPGTLRLAAKALDLGPRVTREKIAAGEVPAEPFLTLFDDAFAAEFRPK